MLRVTLGNACLGLMMVVLGTAAVAEEASRGDYSRQAIFQLDNDLFSGSDRDYTNGLRIGYVREHNSASEVSRFLEKWLLPLTGVKRPSRIFPWRDRTDLRFATGVGLTQLMFTPEDFNAASAPEGERPYAGWLGIEYSVHVKNASQVSSVTLALGTTGEHSYAQEAQEWVHLNISDSPIFQGWDSQIPNQFTVNFHVDQKRPLHALTAYWGALMMDSYYEWGGALGNFQTNAYLGALARFGWNLPTTHAAPRVQLGSYGNELFSRGSSQAHAFSVFSFFGARATAVAHDITLDGPAFSTYDTGVESTPLVGEVIAGIGLRYGFLDASFSQTLRSNEFYGQSENQLFGSFQLRFQSSF